MTAADYKLQRQRRGTQQGVAVLLGVDYRTIQRRECGDIEITREAELAMRALPVRWAAGAGRGARKPSPARRKSK
jgi:hypothetical protein